jgi:hypothetical protein
LGYNPMRCDACRVSLDIAIRRQVILWRVHRSPAPTVAAPELLAGLPRFLLNFVMRTLP